MENMDYNVVNSDMSGNDKAMGIIAYITWIGLILAAVLGGENGRRSAYLKFHLNQSLVLYLFALLSIIPFIGWIWGIFVFVCWIIALVGACSGQMKRVPLIGGIELIK